MAHKGYETKKWWHVKILHGGGHSLSRETYIYERDKEMRSAVEEETSDLRNVSARWKKENPPAEFLKSQISACHTRIEHLKETIRETEEKIKFLHDEISRLGYEVNEKQMQDV